MEEKIEVKGKETLVCRVGDNPNTVQCDVYREGKFEKTFIVPREKLKDILGE